jgi:hypothetical protein
VAQHEFDETRARRYRTRSSFVKTAILVRLVDPSDTVTIRAPFGPEGMRGEFYIVASEEGSYGASRTEFEDSHIEVEPNRWVKHATVDAYEATEACRVDTHLADGTHEASVEVRPGDWIVRQPAGEVMALDPAAFALRYEAADKPEG